MGTIAKGEITLSPVNDAYTVLLTPASCTILADFDGSNPKLENAVTSIVVKRGAKAVDFKVRTSHVSSSGIEFIYTIQPDKSIKATITRIPNSILNGWVSFDIETEDGFHYTTNVQFNFSVVRESSMLDWILDWEGRKKTEIAGEYIITPKIFVGKSEDGGKLTGTYIGPAFDNSSRVGVFGYSAGIEIFHLDNTGGMIGGWHIEDGGIQTSDGVLKILSEGTIISAPDGRMAWQLIKDGSASFASGNVNFYANGDADFRGKINSSSGKIGGWLIGEHSLYNQAILIDSDAQFIGIGCAGKLSAIQEPTYEAFYNSIKQSGGIAIFSQNYVSYGIECWVPNTTVVNPSLGATEGFRIFKLGYTNEIAGWNFDNDALWRGVKNNTARQNTTSEGSVTIGSAGIRGINWYIDDDGEISFVEGLLHFNKTGGTIAGWTLNKNMFAVTNAALVSATGYTGLYLSNSVLPKSYTSYESHITKNGGIYLSTSGAGPRLHGRDSNGKLVFQLTGGVSFVGGWWFNNECLFTGISPAMSDEFATQGNITLSPDGLRGYKFRLEASGSGAIAGGKISWDDNGNVTFDNSVKISWSQVAGTDGVMTKATYIDSNGIFTGRVSADNITTGTLSADRINTDSLLSNGEKWALLKDGSGYLASKNISWNKEGDLCVRGEIEATSGRIAGFQISGNSLTNAGFNNDACIIFRNDKYNVFGAIGGNTLPVSSAFRAVARFENNDSTGSWFSRNIALYLSAQNGAHNHAFTGYGNGTLNGWIGGYRFDRFILTSVNTIYTNYIDLNKNNKWICKSTVRNSGIVLPRLKSVQDALGVDSSTPFCIDLLIVSDIGTNSYFIYGRTDRKDSNDQQPWISEQYPVFVHWDGGRWERQEVGAGDCFHFLLVYDPNETQSLDGFSCKYTARVISKLV